MSRCCSRLLCLAAFAVMAGCASVPIDAPKPVGYAVAPASDGRLHDQLAREAFALDAPDASALRLLNTGHEAWEDRLHLVRTADHSLDFQYFSWSKDESGRVMLSHVVEAADRGVRVRLLIDDMLVTDQAFFAPLQAHPNIDIRLFNPFATQRADTLVRPFEWLAKDRLNVRMHNKILIADSLVGVLGGRNIQNRYFWVDPGFVHRDLDVLTIGAIVPELGKSFDIYWNSPWAVPIEQLERIPGKKKARRYYDELRAYRESEHIEAWFSELALVTPDDHAITPGMVSGVASLLADSPDKVVNLEANKYQALVDVIEEESRDNVVMGMAYVIPDAEMMAHWQGLIDRGVELELMTNSMAAIDFSAAFSGWEPYRDDLVDMGMEVYEFAVDASWPTCNFNCSEGHKSYHSKLVVIDDDLSYVGSMNYDPRSIQLNTEVGLLVEGEAFASKVRNVFYEDARSRNAWHLGRSSPLTWSRPGENGDVEVAQDDPNAGLIRWLGVKFWRAMVPLRDQY